MTEAYASGVIVDVPPVACPYHPFYLCGLKGSLFADARTMFIGINVTVKAYIMELLLVD